MARTKAVLGTGARLADYLSASLLARVIPAQVVNEVLDAHGCNTQRLRSFPAVVGVYYTVALSLYPEAAYEEVFAAIAQGLAWAARAREPVRISKVSISNARAKIGWVPLHELMRRCCVRAWVRIRSFPKSGNRCGCRWWGSTPATTSTRS